MKMCCFKCNRLQIITVIKEGVNNRAHCSICGKHIKFLNKAEYALFKKEEGLEGPKQSVLNYIQKNKNRKASLSHKKKEMKEIARLENIEMWEA